MTHFTIVSDLVICDFKEYDKWDAEWFYRDQVLLNKTEHKLFDFAVCYSLVQTSEFEFNVVQTMPCHCKDIQCHEHNSIDQMVQ